LSYVVQLTYNKTSRTLSNEKNFSKNFILLGLTTAIVITIVKSSLALSLGLVGALSIVRFRAAIKEPEELVYLFLIIAIGLGCGAGQVKITIAGTIIAIITILILYLRNKKSQKLGLETFNVSLVTPQKINSSELKGVVDVMSQHSNKCELVSISSSQDNSSINLIVNISDFESITKLNQEINKKFPNLDFVLVRETNLNE
tara:strand:+ start:651 stop:1253 length:603 start_codon:yes stop_codon:yes gene_type:complete